MDIRSSTLKGHKPKRLRTTVDHTSFLCSASLTHCGKQLCLSAATVFRSIVSIEQHYRTILCSLPYKSINTEIPPCSFLHHLNQPSILASVILHSPKWALKGVVTLLSIITRQSVRLRLTLPSRTSHTTKVYLLNMYSDWLPHLYIISPF